MLYESRMENVMARARSAKHVPKAAPEPLSVEDVVTQYRDQWVLLRITDYDEDHWPSEGHVVAHGSEKRVHKIFAALASTPGAWDPPYYLFCAFPRGRTGDDLRAAIAAAAKLEDLGGRTPW